MRDALIALNAMVAQDVLPVYAVSGAIAAALYIEAASTADLDVFVTIPPSPSGLITLAPIYAAAEALGGVEENEHIRFGAWPVQIRPAATPLVEEALRDAMAVNFDGIPTRVLTPEHLCAIDLETGRIKDHLRVARFIEEKAVDVEALADLLARHDLLDRHASVLNLLPERSTTVQPIMQQALADKAAQRVTERARSWPEKIAVIERLRDATQSMRRSMRTSERAAPNRPAGS